MKAGMDRGIQKVHVAKNTSIFGRIARVIDTLDSAAHRGQYQTALGIDGALALMNDPLNLRTAGKFDPEILELMTNFYAPKRPFLFAEKRPFRFARFKAIALSGFFFLIF